MKEKAISILKEKSLRITKTKTQILEVFLNSKKSYALSEVESIFKNNFDRSTIFRTLQTLAQNKILEQFIDARGVGVYVLHEHENHCNTNNHYHFKCNDCENVMPLPKLPETYIALLGGNSIKSLNLFVEGTCEDCQAGKKE